MHLAYEHFEPYMGQNEPNGQICTRCVMDSSDPEIRFDACGVCNHCHERDARVASDIKDPTSALRELSALVEEIRADGKGKIYDCLIGVSGGVDSTYVAFEVKRLGLRPLAVHLDNGWDSEIAVGNIHSALDKLGIPLHTHVINWEEIRDIQLAFLRSGVVDCEIPSDHAIVSSVQNLAKKLGIRHTIWGYNVISETHLPSSWSQGHYDFGYIRAVHRIFGNKNIRIKTFPHLSFWSYVTKNRYNQRQTNLLDYVSFNKKEAISILSNELGWRKYGGKHHESIYTRWYQGWYLPVRWGYDKRKTHLSSLVCSGEITRSEALLELALPTYNPETQKEDIAYVMKKFGLNEAEFRDLMTVQRRHFREFASYYRFFSGPVYGSFLKVWQFFKYTVRGRSPNLN